MLKKACILILAVLLSSVTLIPDFQIDVSADSGSSTGTLFSFNNTTLYENDFETKDTAGWDFQDQSCRLETGNSNTVLSITGHKMAYYTPSEYWSDYIFTCKFRLDGQCHINVRAVRDMQQRYIVGLGETYYLKKLLGSDDFDLMEGKTELNSNSWNTLKIDLSNNVIKVYLNDAIVINYTDREVPLLTGAISLECLEASILDVDDISITGLKIEQKNRWVKTGGPIGGLGYDIRISPKDKNIMFVSDNPSGVNKSTNGGKTWSASNQGIIARGGSSEDTIPIFCVTIDPNNPDIIWSGTQTMRGIYKSTDCGSSWSKMDNGVTEWNEITFRGFTIKPGDSDVVFAAAEITTELQGKEFNRAKGKIYKTIDGGRNWTCVWQGDSLARVIIFDPQNTDVLYASTGIFDRDAYNLKGEGILKSIDGGKTWNAINKGLENLFAGFLEMHPSDPNILFCAAGNYTHQQGGGIYRTSDRGATWKKLLSTGENTFTVVTISKANPNIIYAGNAFAFYRSDDSGMTWKKHNKDREGCYGPPGIRAGVPISAVVDPDDTDTIYVNNYGGGVFRSTDGAKTWVDCSRGYTGADLHKVAVSPEDSGVVYTIGRSGPFRSTNSGEKWDGLAYGLSPAEWYDIAVNPGDPEIVLCSDEHQAVIFRSTDGGMNWNEVFRKEGVNASDPANRHGFRALEFAPSNPQIVYAGMRMQRNAIDGDAEKKPSYGMFISKDCGITWQEINNGIKDTDKNINCIAVHPKDPDTAYIGTFRDGVFKTSDGGANWIPASNGLMSEDVRSLYIDLSDPETLYAGLGSGTGLYKTVNGGKEWFSASSGLVIECPSYLQRIGQVSIGISLEKPKRLTSTDYAATPWTLISSIAMDLKDSNILYISDYHLGVFISTNSGESWWPINDGLDIKSVTSLSLSKDGKVIYASTSGGGVYRLELEKSPDD
ncbi:MAG TPA: family 16 glycoside hydrolase [Clostridia bacterium]|nr:family 16 glycoside hydrolase [Clostridia bacterium]